MITFGEANSKKWLDVGIPVIFKNSIVGTIELEQEMTGKKQKVKLDLSNGITVRSKKENEFAIFAVLRIISKEGLIFKGRYGRANCIETINYLIKVVQKKNEKSNCYFLTIDDFYDFCLNDCMVLQCMQNALFRDEKGEFGTFEPVIFKDDTKLLELYTKGGSLSNEFEIFPGSEEKIIYNIGIAIEGKEIVVDLKKSIKKLIDYRYSFYETPYSYYIEVE